MQLSITYQNGGSRVINLHKTFFAGNDISWEERATTLAHDSGKPYRIRIHCNGDEVLNKRVVAFSPAIERHSVSVDESMAKKQLRKQFKRIPFTSSYKYQL